MSSQKRVAKPSWEMGWGKGRESKAASKLALLLSGDDGMVQTALITPLLASIAIHYPDASEWLLDQVMAITATCMIPSMLVSSKLAQYFDKKKIIMIGTIIFSLAGMSGMLTSSIEMLVLTRALLGIGAGLAFPLVPSAISYLFKEREKNQMLGWMNSMGAFFSFTLSIMAGVIALTNWKHAFWFYGLFLIVTVIQYFVLPNFKPEKQEIEEERARPCAKPPERKEPLGWRVWVTGFGMLCFMIIGMVATFKISLFVEGYGLGTPADSGFCISAMTCCSFAISLIFARYLQLFKKFAPIVSLFFLMVSFGLLATAESVAMAVVAMGFLGLSMGTMNPFFFSMMSRVVPMTRTTLAMSMICVFQLGGQIITPYYMMAVSALGFDTIRSLFGFTAVFLGVATIVLFVITLVARWSSQQGREDGSQV